jgi:hypothetical protein
MSDRVLRSDPDPEPEVAEVWVEYERILDRQQ